MTFATVGLTIYDRNFKNCHISELDGWGNDFVSGATDFFEGEELLRCESFFVEDNTISMLRLHHSGMDGWKADYVNIHFDDGKFVNCPVGEFIDGDDVKDVSCS